MAAGTTILSTDVDRWFKNVVGADPLLAQYCPATQFAFGQRPPQDAQYPVIRWWEQSWGNDVLRQDGQLGRAESQPRYILCVVDRQREGQIDKQYGTYGGAQEPPQPWFEAAGQRLASLFSPARLETLNGILWSANIIGAYQGQDATGAGMYDVMLGVFLQIRAQ